MKMYVIDNSALIPLFFEEEGTQLIQRLFERVDVELIAPRFLAIELANVITTGIRREKITPSEGARHLHDFQQLRLELVDFPSPQNLQHVLDLATKTGLSFYDAVYLGLAEQRGATLVSHDKQLRVQAEQEGVELYE